MAGTILLSLLLLQTSAAAPAAPAQPQVASAPQAKTSESAPTDKKQELVKVHRIYVDSFGTTEAAQQLQAMVIASLTDSSQLTVTEDKSKADAVLKGFASEQTSQETHAYGSGTAVSSAAGGHSASISGSHGNISGSAAGGFHAAGAGINDSSVNTETIDHAKASVRLVNQEGDVIWTSTQESKGAKFKGASADVADKIVKELIRDIEKAQKPPGTAAEAK